MASVSRPASPSHLSRVSTSTTGSNQSHPRSDPEDLAREMVKTRLVNLDTHLLESFEIAQMPPYAAVSHVWTEGLFPVAEIKAMDKTNGMALVSSALKQIHFQRPAYCWIDTWCIDQDDDEDKRVQIPLMRDIYRDAEFVIITTNHRFSFSQQDWDAALDAARYFFEVANLPTKQWMRAKERLKPVPISAADALYRAWKMLTEMATISWAKRIWTAQEYILAQAQFWIGKDERLIRLGVKDMIEINTALTVWLGEIQSALGQAFLLTEEGALGAANFDVMNRIKVKHISPVMAMKLAGFRQSFLPKDEVYGLMGATGVVITAEKHDNLELSWRKWWEASTRAGNLELIYTPVLFNRNGILDNTWNCVMPPWEYRCVILQWALTERAKPWEELHFQDGTLIMTGKLAGVCFIDRYLCHDIVPEDLDGLSKLCGKDLELAQKVCFAVDSGFSPREEILERAKCVHAAFRLANEGENMSQEAQDRLKDITATYSKAPFQVHSMTSIHLGHIKNEHSTTYILVFTGEEIYRGDLFWALDFQDGSDQGNHELKQLLIARVPVVSGDPLHKAGMTHPMRFHTNKTVRAHDCGGCSEFVLNEPPRKFLVGGSRCWYCKESRSRMQAQLAKSHVLPDGWKFGYIPGGGAEENSPEDVPSTARTRGRPLCFCIPRRFWT